MPELTDVLESLRHTNTIRQLGILDTRVHESLNDLSVLAHRQKSISTVTTPELYIWALEDFSKGFKDAVNAVGRNEAILCPFYQSGYDLGDQIRLRTDMSYHPQIQQRTLFREGEAESYGNLAEQVKVVAVELQAEFGRYNDIVRYPLEFLQREIEMTSSGS